MFYLVDMKEVELIVLTLAGLSIWTTAELLYCGYRCAHPKHGKEHEHGIIGPCSLFSYCLEKMEKYFG